MFVPVVYASANWRLIAVEAHSILQWVWPVKTFVFGAGAYSRRIPARIRSVAEGGTLGAQNQGGGQYLSHAVNSMTFEFDLTKSFELTLTDSDNRIDSIFGGPRTTSKECEEKAEFVDILRPAIKAMFPEFFDSLRSESAKLGLSTWTRRGAASPYDPGSTSRFHWTTRETIL